MHSCVVCVRFPFLSRLSDIPLHRGTGFICPLRGELGSLPFCGCPEEYCENGGQAPARVPNAAQGVSWPYLPWRVPSIPVGSLMIPVPEHLIHRSQSPQGKFQNSLEDVLGSKPLGKGRIHSYKSAHSMR